MQQHYEQYTAEDHEVWSILFERQRDNLLDKACKAYLNCLEELSGVLHSRAIPNFRELDASLMARTGWSIEVVPGLIPASDFFALLSWRRFCSSTWLRSRAMLDYLEEPDMFHDIFGHVPLLAHPGYADFMQELGKLGVKHQHDPQGLQQLENLYWFTVEFGLVSGTKGPEIYGAGIASSFGESKLIYTDKVEIVDFDLERILDNGFVKSEMQGRYYALPKLEALFDILEEVDRCLSAKRKPRPASMR